MDSVVVSRDGDGMVLTLYHITVTVLLLAVGHCGGRCGERDGVAVKEQRDKLVADGD